MRGRDDADAAAREAYEEAGVKGVMSRAPIGRYRYEKLIPEKRPIPCWVDVFALEVDRELEKWPEAGERERKWMPLGEASLFAFEPGLAELLGKIEPAQAFESASAGRRRKHR